MMKKNGYIYLTLAVGGTRGMPTSHGVFLYRARKVQGPWERCPYNPIIRTYSRHDRWQSKGHGMPIEAPNGSWYLIYHGTQKNRANHGRQPLLEPIEWTEDGWYRVKVDSVPDKPLPIPKGGKAVIHGYPAKVTFPQAEILPCQWIYQGSIRDRIENRPEGMVVKGCGTSLNDTGGVVCYNALFDNFEIITELTISPGGGGGLSMYYNPYHCAGFSLKNDWIWVHEFGNSLIMRQRGGTQYFGDHIYLKMKVCHQVATCWYSSDGKNYNKLPVGFYFLHINPLAEIPRGYGTSMYPALFAYGTGEVLFHSFEIKELFLTD
jgi:beta-xylosidase